MSIAEKLQSRLRDELGLDVSIPVRTYAGVRQLEGWAWSWSADLISGGLRVGSIETMASCVKARKLQPLSPKFNLTLDIVCVK